MDASHGACVSYVAGRTISIDVGFKKSSTLHVVKKTTPILNSALVHKSFYVVYRKTTDNSQLKMVGVKR